MFGRRCPRGYRGVAEEVPDIQRTASAQPARPRNWQSAGRDTSDQPILKLAISRHQNRQSADRSARIGSVVPRTSKPFPRYLATRLREALVDTPS